MTEPEQLRVTIARLEDENRKLRTAGERDRDAFIAVCRDRDALAFRLAALRREVTQPIFDTLATLVPAAVRVEGYKAAIAVFEDRGWDEPAALLHEHLRDRGTI